MRRIIIGGMRRIIIVQNHVVSGLLVVIGLTTRFYGNGLKAVLFAVMSFILIDLGLREVERYYLRILKDDKGSREKSKGSSLPNIHWFKMRFCDIKQDNRHSRNNIATICKDAGNNTTRQSDHYRRCNGR